LFFRRLSTEEDVSIFEKSALSARGSTIGQETDEALELETEAGARVFSKLAQPEKTIKKIGNKILLTKSHLV
jgi:hypothetical protein